MTLRLSIYKVLYEFKIGWFHWQVREKCEEPRQRSLQCWGSRFHLCFKVYIASIFLAFFASVRHPGAIYDGKLFIAIFVYVSRWCFSPFCSMYSVYKWRQLRGGYVFTTVTFSVSSFLNKKMFLLKRIMITFYHPPMFAGITNATLCK